MEGGLEQEISPGRNKESKIMSRYDVRREDGYQEPALKTLPRKSEH
jgi:hypothetical protein